MTDDAAGRLSPVDRPASNLLGNLVPDEQGAASDADPRATLLSMLEVAREVTGARYAALGAHDQSRRELTWSLTSGIDPPGWATIDRSEMEALEVPIELGGEAWGSLCVMHEPGARFDEADERRVTAVAGWAAVAVQNARLHAAAAKDRADLGHAVRGLEATVAIARAIGGETKLDRVLELIAERGRALIRAWALVILLAEGDELVLAARAGSVGVESLGRRMPLAGSAFERVVREGVVLEQVSDPFAGADPALAGLSTPDALIVPLRYRGRGVGTMVAFAPVEQPEGFREEQADLLDSVAVSAAIAVRTAQDVEHDRARRGLQAAEAERTRWARELHDGTLQGLGALQISLETARRTPDSGLRDRVLAEAADQATEEISQLRALITDLRPVALDELGIAAALEALVDRTQRMSGLPIGISTIFTTGDATRRHAPELETAIYRIVQEALSNAVKHSGATRVDVTVRERDDRVELVVEDDGKGFDARSPSTGFGLMGMRERVELEHGTVRVISGPGTGTRAEISLPARRRTTV